MSHGALRGPSSRLCRSCMSDSPALVRAAAPLSLLGSLLIAARPSLAQIYDEQRHRRQRLVKECCGALRDVCDRVFDFDAAKVSRASLILPGHAMPAAPDLTCSLLLSPDLTSFHLTSLQSISHHTTWPDLTWPGLT